MKPEITVGLVDDHVMLRKGLADTIEKLGYKVILQASSGLEFCNNLDKNGLPRVVLMDIQMPGMNGFDTTFWLNENYPQIDVLALSMYDDEASIIKMLRCGAKGYVLKDNEPAVLKAAIDAIAENGFYYSELVTGKIVRSLSNPESHKTLTPRHVDFLTLVCSELTYKEIADKMMLSPRTIDGYRDELFEKLNVKSRVGLVLYAVKNRLVSIDSTPLKKSNQIHGKL